MKLTAQFYPIQNNDPFEASLQIQKGQDWIDVAHARIEYPGYTASFRVENWEDSREEKYRVAYNNIAYYEGIIRRNPRDKDEFIMAAFSCNSIYPRHAGSISRKDIIDNLKKLKPDLLFFAGDQVYDHSSHLQHWLRFGRDFGEVIRNTPTITIPDDHDIGQGNLWGAGGIRGIDRNGQAGGYYMPVSYIEEVERAQTSHLPDPYDPTPVEQGIGVYYTDLKWGGVSFAILEDRKFKTGPEVYRERHLRNKNAEEISEIDPKIFDAPEAVLLGERQLTFLRDWADDWEDAAMKAVLSQTVFCQSTSKGERNLGGKRVLGDYRFDFDSNGWPQTGRNKALKEIRKGFSCMIGGDQHLGSVIQHGVDDWNDAGYSFATPAIANLWCRIWDPNTPGQNRKPGSPEYTGEFEDKFDNKITYHAAANPDSDLYKAEENQRLATRAAGYGIVRFNKENREITFECWPRMVDISAPESEQYPGWPVTISQFDNFNIKGGYELPSLKISESDQVVTVVDHATGEVFSSVRILGQEYQPKVLKSGRYDILVGESGEQKVFKNLKSRKENNKVLNVLID